MSKPDSSRTPNSTGNKAPSWLIVIVMLGILGFVWWQNNHAAQFATFTENSEVATLPDENAPTRLEVSPESEETKVPGSDQIPGPDRDASEPAKLASPHSLNEPRSLRAADPRPAPDAKTNPDRSRESGPLSGMRARPSAGSPTGSSKSPVPDRTRPTEKSEPPSKTQKSSLQVENQTIRDLNGRVIYKGTIDLAPTLDRIERDEENRHRNDGTSFQNREGRLPRKVAGYYKEYVHPTKGEYGPGPQRIIIGRDGEVWYTPDHYKTFKKIK